MARAVDCPVPLTSYALLRRLDECISPYASYLGFLTRRQAGSLLADAALIR